jgi:hypothetical protein
LSEIGYSTGRSDKQIGKMLKRAVDAAYLAVKVDGNRFRDIEHPQSGAQIDMAPAEPTLWKIDVRDQVVATV